MSRLLCREAIRATRRISSTSVGYVVRKAILEPDNEEIYAAYSLIRENLRTERDGQALRLVRYTTGQDNIDEERYRPLL